MATRLADSERYNSSSDDDFDPAVAGDDSASASGASDAPETAPARQRKARRKKQARDRGGPTSLPEIDSGDEATIAAARRRRAPANDGRTQGSEAEREDGDGDIVMVDDNDDDAQAGWIKTRAQRRSMRSERVPAPPTAASTLDVDAVWAQLSCASLGPARRTEGVDPTSKPASDAALAPGQLDSGGPLPTASFTRHQELVSISRATLFAGQRSAQHKRVARCELPSFRAQGWKEVQPEGSGQSHDATEAATPTVDTRGAAEAVGTLEVHADGAAAPPRARAPRRRRLRFDPNPTGRVRSLPAEHQLRWPRTAAGHSDAGNESALDTPASATQPQSAAVATRPEKALRLNVVDKSRLDWTGFVDNEGIADELDVHGKGRDAYLGRMHFLAAVEGRRDELRRGAGKNGGG